MAEVIEDPKKKKASFGDAAAAATDPGITQLSVGKPGDFPVNPDGTMMNKQAPVAPSLGALGTTAPTVPTVLTAPTTPVQAGALSKYDQDLKNANDQAAARLARPVATADVSGATSSYLELQQKANDLKPSYFSQVTPTSSAMLAQAQSDADNALGAVYTQGGQASPASIKAGAQNPALTGVRMNEITDPRSLLYPGRQDPVQAAATTAPMADPASTPPAPAPIAAGAVKTQGQMNMESDLRSAEAMKAERLAAEGRAPQAVVTHSGNDWQARNNLRNLEVSASSMTAQPKDLMAYQIARKHDTELQGGGTAADIANLAAANRNNEINSIAQVANARTAQQGQQFGASQELAKQRLALDNRKADIADAGAQMDNATKKQLQDLNAQILKETDPAKLAVLQEKAQTLTGKYQRPDPANRDVYGAIAGGTDAMGNKTDPIIYNKQTGERVGAQSPVAPPKVDEVRGGYKFKGGNPADQKNWEKV